MADFVFDPPLRLARDVTVRTLDDAAEFARTYVGPRLPRQRDRIVRVIEEVSGEASGRAAGQGMLGGPSTPPGHVFLLECPDRKAERPASHLEAFRGVLQVDGYAGFERLTDRGNIVLAACWAHTRRKFFDVHEATGSPIAAEALRRIAELYAIEKSIRGRTAEERRIVRNTQSRPLVEAMKPWLETQLGRIPGRGGLAEAIRYTLSRWPALGHFLDDGRIELDNNSVERAIRPVALGRKNHLFAGSDGGAERWATVCSLIASAKLNDVEPFTYLRDILQRMTEGHPMSRLDELLPWNWPKIGVKH